jgi:iron complex outermembrane receptor protein
MKTLTLAARLPATASVLAIAATFVVAPAAVSAQAQIPVTATEEQQCEALPTQPERDLCVQGKAGDEASPNEQGELATLPPAEQAEQATEGGTIVVTGSRLRRTEFTSPDPIQVINPELGAREGKNQTVDLINSSPIAAGSTQITGAISGNFVTNGGEGAQTVSLRGLGAERTLILLNGRRMGPAGVRGAVASVDLNTIPSSIVSSIEILKTGASSIYGSDAIAGVVNILTKRSTKGIELRGFTAIPEEGGSEIYNVSATWGKEFERGHILVTADYFQQKDLKRNDRKFLDCNEEYLTFVDGRRADIVDGRTGRPACNGVLENAILTNNDFSFLFGEPGLVAPNGEQLFVSQFAVGNELADAGCVQINQIPGITAPDNFFGCNFDGPSTGVLNQYSGRERRSDVFPGVKRKTLYAEGSFELTPNVELFTELLYNNRKTHTDSIQQVSVFQFTGSSFLPQIGFCAPTDFNCSPTDAGDPFNDEFSGNFLLRPLIGRDSASGTDIDYYRGLVGGRGTFAKGFNWDVHAQYSRSDGDYFQDITLADSIFTQDFRTKSCVGLVTPVTGRPCIDIDFTDPRVLRGDFNAEERAFLFDRDLGNTLYQQLAGEATVSGDLFQLPAGPVGVAAGVHVRRDQIKDVPGEASLAGNAFNLTSAGITAGKTLTKEIFGEVEIPIVRNVPLIQRLSLSAAGRITRVNAERRDGVEDKFGDETWKVGADWKVNNALRFRGSWGTSFRAPALFELFIENQTGFQTQQDIDVCIDTAIGLDRGTITQRIFDNCAAAGIPDDFQGATGGALVQTSGAIGTLDPETSEAKVVGAVFTPTLPFLPDTQFSVAVDYFDIEVRDEITRLGAANIVIGCYDSPDFANEPLCNLITRLPVGDPDELNISEIQDPYLNVSSQRNRGIDVSARINHDFGRFGEISLLGQMTWQLEDKLDLFGNEGSIVELNGEVGEPKWVGDFNLTWENGPWTLVYGLDVVGSADNRGDLREEQGDILDENGCRTSIFRPGAPAGQPRVPFCPDVSVPAVAYHAMSVTREIGEKFEFTLGVANIFDKKPPRVSTVINGGIDTLGQVPVFASQYDYLGRRFFVSVRGAF